MVAPEITMQTDKPLEKLTMGVGDRFAHQAKAQLRACQLIEDGVDVVPAWNKSNREHSFIGSDPPSVLAAFQSEPASTSSRGLQAAAREGRTYLDLLKANEEVVGRNVTNNLYQRHLRPLFGAL